MMTETQEFLEQLKDPLRYSVQKSVYELWNRDNNSEIIYDIRIQQINELPYYHIILKADNAANLSQLHNEMLDIFDEYLPPAVNTISHHAPREEASKMCKTYYIYDNSLMPNVLNTYMNRYLLRYL